MTRVKKPGSARDPRRPVRRLSLSQYLEKVIETDKLPLVLEPTWMGLFGEVGSIMATAKKLHREDKAYQNYNKAVEEEFGDTFWYLAALCRRLGVSNEVLSSSVRKARRGMWRVPERSTTSTARLSTWPAEAASRLNYTLQDLGEATSVLSRVKPGDGNAAAQVETFTQHYIQALELSGGDFLPAINRNYEKATGRFSVADPRQLPDFDTRFAEDERLPEHFEIHIKQRGSGHLYLQYNGVFIGDPLTDNIMVSDGYRFHDVFHFAHAAVLHWSPTFRSLIKQKRKSDKLVDEAQDGGRAIVIEEGLTAWIFSQAKEMNLFADYDRLSFDLLKTVGQFVRGYEVDVCPLSLWERAILGGYSVFREVLKNEGGIVVGDRRTRTITYRRFGYT